jgi:pSer/pThr/pTyr-binding forkhead associated (FHA) protein
MKIRLDVNVPLQPRYSFEHQGAAVRIGRDPEGELVFQGEACQCVSWNHACIELTTGGAFLSDLGSSNGTFVNDQRLAGRAPLRPGDRIRMGQTGPVLQVVDLQLSGPRLGPADARAKQLLASLESSETAIPAPGQTAPGQPGGGFWDTVDRLRWPLLIAAGAFAVLAFVLLLVVLLRSKPPVADAGGGTTTPTAPTRPAEDPNKETSQAAGTKPKPAPGDDQKPSPKAVQPQPYEPPPQVNVASAKPTGTYVVGAKEPPSVLLQRQRDPDPWGRLKPESRIHTGYYLLSLPGYRSRIRLDSGVILVLWGNVPEFAPFPPLLESTVMLNDPEPGTDLDLTLDHGRVLIYNNKLKEKGPAKVRVRFYQEVWDLTLPDHSSEVVLELWGQFPPDVPFSKEPGGKGPNIFVGLHNKGPVSLAVRGQTYELTKPSRVVWSNRATAVMGPDALPDGKPPAWWTDRLEPGKSPVADAMMIALSDLSAALGKTEAVVDAVWTQVTNADEEPLRRLGVLCLGALDALVELAQALEDGRRPLVRSTAIHALRHWISRGPDYELELYRALQEKKKYAKEKAETIVQLLHLFSPADVRRPETYQRLIGLLDHDSLPVRELALWHLTQMVPQGLKTIKFDPAGDSESRQKAIAEWKKLIPPGSLPPPPDGKR